MSKHDGEQINGISEVDAKQQVFELLEDSEGFMFTSKKGDEAIQVISANRDMLTVFISDILYRMPELVKPVLHMLKFRIAEACESNKSDK